ncbi:hypothetical protein [Streptomyces sp. BH104]|uniref:hypothetical protein n=1 Tax=Streptomyces sp. BH104 TaxID=3410407 RepID=UPI003BB6E1BE
MGRKFKDIETPEQAYARQTSGARVSAATDRAISHRRAAHHEEQQITTASYSTPESREMGIAKIGRADDADRRGRNAKRHREQAAAADREVQQAKDDAKPKKRGWLW